MHQKKKLFMCKRSIVAAGSSHVFQILSTYIKSGIMIVTLCTYDERQCIKKKDFSSFHPRMNAMMLSR